MKPTTSTFIAALMTLAMTAAACGGGSPSSPSPTPSPSPSPAPAPAPAPVPPPAPAPSGPMMAFTPDTTTPGSRTFSLQPADMNGDDIYVGLYAKDFGKDSVNMARATIGFDPAIVQLVSYSSAESWMSTSGAPVSFSVGTSGGNQVKVRVDVESSSAGASGSGRILRLRFRKVSAGSSRLDFVEGHAYDSGYNDSLKGGHGGTLVVK